MDPLPLVIMGNPIHHSCFASSIAHCYRVSLKVAAFHELDDSQGPKKRPRILPANLEDDIETPSLTKGPPSGDSSQGCTPIENPFSQPNSQHTPRTNQAKDPKEKVRSAREQVEAKMLRKMVKIPSTSC